MRINDSFYQQTVQQNQALQQPLSYWPSAQSNTVQNFGYSEYYAPQQQDLFSAVREKINQIDSAILNYIENFQGSELFEASPALLQAFQGGSSRDKLLVLADTLSKLSTVNYSGTYHTPNTINNVAVIGSQVTSDGQPGFLLADNSVVSKSEVLTSYNAATALQAVALLTSDADSSNKITALTQLGINAGVANEVVSEANAGHFSTALSVFNTASNWGDMNDDQRITSSLQTGSMLIQSADDLGYSITGASGTASTVGSIAGGLAGVAGVVMGVDQAADVIDAISDMPKSDAQKAGAIGLGTAGAAIAAGGIAAGAMMGATIGSTVPVVGTIIGGAVGALAGFAIGSFGSGKSRGQMKRDSWRDTMEQAGFAQKIDGSHHVPLANGTMYNIGFDGGHKLTNVDGTERHTFDVDWNNPLAKEAIPEAHIFALATGLDPSQGDLWHTATSQAVNAATSNATTQAEVTANLQTMLKQGGVDPREVGLKLEILRASNKISEQEYGVYLSKINKLFGTKLMATEKAKATITLIANLQSIPNPSKQELALLQSIIEANSPQKTQSKEEVQS